ncbi:MAG: ABC transporter ATP-binding protein [Planctomycetes bacterium]|nr:ABC transporter ATP-binding protein [Planctomycetota bacterium]
MPALPSPSAPAPSPAPPLLSTENLTKTFRLGGRPLTVVNGVTCAIERGEIVAVVGPSGAGKSTLLQLLGLIDRPTAGELRFAGRALTRLSASERARHRNRHFGFVFQFFHLLSELTALENVLLPRMIDTSFFAWPGRRAGYRRRAEELLARLGLSARLRHRPSQLSGGERQRVAIARALINDPDVLFCDEPTGTLDHATSLEIQDLLWELNRTLGKTFVIVTHSESIARRAHRVLSMEDGRLVEGPPPAPGGAPAGDLTVPGRAT